MLVVYERETSFSPMGNLSCDNRIPILNGWTHYTEPVVNNGFAKT